MTQPVLQVLIGFQTTTGFGQPFQLNDPFYGVLTTAGRGTLGGIQMADVTEFVQSVSINRGRSRQLDEFNCGTAQINLWNKTRTFDPLNQSSPYWIGGAIQQTGVVPRLPGRWSSPPAAAACQANRPRCDKDAVQSSHWHGSESNWDARHRSG